MSKIPVSLQLYSVREATAKDFAATVREVAAIGYTGVELAGYGNLDATGARAALNAAGLRVSGMHMPIEALRNELPRVIAEARLMGTTQVILPWLPPALFATAASCTEIATELDRIGADLRAAGLRLSYHNHAAEFALVEGRPVLDWLLDASSPRNLGCELDVYWSHVGGKNPGAYIREQGRRIGLLHLKDEKELGLGPVNFTEVFTAAEAIGAVAWYVVEQEQYNHAPLHSVRLCFEQLRRWGRA